MKKSEFPRINKNIFTVSALFAAGFIFQIGVDEIIGDFYYSKKNNLERKLGSYVNKKIELGEYGGLNFLGFSLNNSKILDDEFKKVSIRANNISIRIMPFRSILNRKWIFNINPRKLDLNFQEEFFSFENNSPPKSQIDNKRLNYELYFNLKKRSNLKIKDIGLEAQIKGNLVYRSYENQLIGSVSTFLKDKGNIKVDFNKKFNNEFLKFKILSKGVNIKDLNYNFKKENINIKKGFLKSNLTFFNSDNKNYCKGKLSVDDFKFNFRNLNENINTESFDILCKNNKIISNIRDINYGTLISDIQLYIPLSKETNLIQIEGELGYINSINPEIKLLGNIPYIVDKNKIKFGSLDTSFNLNRTQLSNLNIFRNNGIRGFITAKGKVAGELNNLKTIINFNIDYPHFKGIRIREIWDGNIINKEGGYLLKMNNRYSPIPSFLSMKVDSKLKLRSLEFSRIFDSNKGSLNVFKDNKLYKWKANNFPLNELELSLNDNQFDRVDGTINGSGDITPDQSIFNGRFSLSLGKYRDIKFANSLFDFKLNENNININSSLYPIDGGMIDVIYKSNTNKFLTVDFLNISANWTALTLLDILNFDKSKIISNGNSKDLNFVEIANNEKTLDEQLAFLKNSKIPIEVSINKKRINTFLNKFEGRYNATLDIFGNEISNYKIKTNLKGYLREKNNLQNTEKNNFTIDLNGGLFSNDGILRISNLPLSLGNLFFDNPKSFKGSLDIKLLYNLTEKNFSSLISSNKTSVNKFNLMFNKGLIDFKDSLFNIDLSLLLDNSSKPISLFGSIPLDINNDLDLRLNGDQRFLELIGNLSNKNFSFKSGDANLRMLIKGSINKPIANGFLFIKDAEVDIFQNNLNDLNATFIFDFDEIEIKDFKAFSNKKGKISLNGSLPFYKELEKKKNSINFISENFKLVGKNINLSVDSNLFLKGSFLSPIISGDIGLKNGFINFKTNNSNGNKNKRVNDKDYVQKSWPELYWTREKEIEIISNESILNKNLFEENLPKFLGNINFDDLYIKLGPDFRIEYANILKAYLDTRINLNINGNVRDDLNARGLVDIRKGRANLYTTPFKLDKNQDNYLLFASRNGVIPYLDFSLTSKVPDSIIPITQNNEDINISNDLGILDESKGFGSFGIGNTRFIKIEASYKGFLDQLSFEDKNQMIQLRSTPSYSRSQIIGLIGGNSSNLINRAFISQINGTDGFSERLQLSLYPALIENTDSVNNIFSSETLELDEKQETSENDGLSSQAWIAEIGLDITDSLNFAMQTTPDRDDIPPLWILTLQANEYLEILGSFDSNGDWKSQVQIFFRY